MSFVHPEVFKLKIENQKLREQLERYKRECHDIDDEEDFCLECEGAILRKALEAMKKTTRDRGVGMREASGGECSEVIYFCCGGFPHEAHGTWGDEQHVSTVPAANSTLALGVSRYHLAAIGRPGWSA